MSTTSQPYAIVRIDHFLLDVVDSISSAITVKKIVWSREDAEAEVDRLNGLVDMGKTEYFYQLTRDSK